MAGSYSLPSHGRRWRDATRAVPAESPGRSPGLTVRSYQASSVGRTFMRRRPGSRRPHMPRVVSCARGGPSQLMRWRPSRPPAVHRGGPSLLANPGEARSSPAGSDHAGPRDLHRSGPLPPATGAGDPQVNHARRFQVGNFPAGSEQGRLITITRTPVPGLGPSRAWQRRKPPTACHPGRRSLQAG
jgi:hypothetical protein